ncbi:MAG: dephospho-CoA kinase [Lachnospiraceae bacterium]|nr:dephospho-CoA kinase [Lachnospiraceae bacterium]MDD7378712.1 dephospho-CoA kinase [Lachnospiraceae bacterium]MDY4618109.1 dephospho-CoA kinase [Lachnospiraceae bacterium]
MKFIGITGGVGAGKSAILEYIAANYNAKVMLADEIAHDLMMPGTKCYDTIKAEFAEEQIFLADGNIDRPRMAQVIFNDAGKRERMNGIVHPAVKDYILEIYREEQEKGELEYLILEAALLIEEHYDEICDELWYIYTSEENRRQRLKENRGYSDEKIDTIFKSQLTEEVYRKYCKVVIDNNHEPEAAFLQIRQQLDEEK